jgi:hypothetical protein
LKIRGASNEMEHNVAQVIGSLNHKTDGKRLLHELEIVGNEVTVSLRLIFVTFHLSREHHVCGMINRRRKLSV